MKALVPIVVLATMASAVPDMLGPMARSSNSKASTQRGREAFVEGRYEDAAREFGVAAGIKPSPEASFNLGTAQIAAGDAAGGLQSLSKAVVDKNISTDVQYNAGWAALEAKDFDNAIHAFEQVLRDRPGDGNAKRNLEIALRKKQEQQEQQQQQQQQQQQPKQQPQPQQPDDKGDQGDQPPPQADQQSKDPSDVDSILRSVEQQEKEELDRMRRSRRGRKADW